MSRFSSRQRRTGSPHRLRVVVIGVGAVVVEGAMLWQRTSQIGGSVIVRCREGHLFTTIWLPGASLKSLRLAAWRYQRCPVGHHWSLVTPVRESELSDDERQLARSHKDIRLP